MITRKTERDILQQSLDALLQDTDVTMTSPGSVARAICGAFARPLSDFYQILDDVRRSGFIATASGFYLDLFGEMFGIPRRLSSVTSIAREDQNIKIYVRSGRLVDRFPHPTNLNLGQIPQGLEITNTSGSVTYRTDANYDFPASATFVFVGAQSSSTGSSQNVGAGELRILPTAGSGVLVTNMADITAGSDVETDNEYRFRISKRVTSSTGANESAVRLAALSIPGIADVIQEEFNAGAGSFRLVLIPIGNRVPVSVLRDVQTAVSSVRAYGISYSIEEPRYLPFSIAVALIGRNGNRSLTAATRDRAEEAIRRYVGNVRPGSTFVVNQLRAAVLDSSEEIADVVVSTMEVNRRPTLLVNFTLRSDELLVPDELMTRPILVS